MFLLEGGRMLAGIDNIPTRLFGRGQTKSFHGPYTVRETGVPQVSSTVNQKLVTIRGNL